MSNILTSLLLGGLMGMVGQGIRAIAGLKKMNDDAQNQNVSSQDLFMASRLVVSLIIGFIAGVIAASTMLTQIEALNPTGNVSVLFGIAAAGYAGTDFIEALAPTIVGGTVKTTAGNSPSVGAVGAQVRAPSVTPHAGQQQPLAGVAYGSLVPGGFYSSDPNNLNVSRSIRTNNPGALNFSNWQSSRKGFVGCTQPDNAGNITTIYRTPEHGVAAWYHLLSQIYGFGATATFALATLAQRYAGVPSGNAVNTYLAGWVKWSSGALSAASTFNVNDVSQMLVLARAMFSHEAGQNTPLLDAQITFGIQNEQAGTLPG